MDAQARWLEQAVALATANVADGGGPFAAVVVRDGVVLATGVNRVTLDKDPTAHAEVVAIRAACAAVGDFALRGATLYASCEPCPLCLSASLWARVEQVVFAADRHDAANGGFDDDAFYRLWAKDRDTWVQPSVRQETVPGALLPFEEWLALDSRAAY